MDYTSANRLLGYADDARLLIINADDFGMCHSINEAILDAWRNGVVSSTTLMVVCPWAPHAMSILKRNPTLPFGVHLTLSRNAHWYRWGPISARAALPSLIDESGYFYSDNRIPELLAQAKIEEVEAEFRAQIMSVLAYDIEPTHLDWHCLADGGRSDIFELTLELAKEFGLAMRIHDRGLARRLLVDGLPANDHDCLDSFRYDPAQKQGQFEALLRKLPSGISEWAVHPSLGNAEAQAMEPRQWQVRRSDYEFAIAPETRTVMAEEGIVLLDYRSIQAVWRQQTSQ